MTFLLACHYKLRYIFCMQPTASDIVKYSLDMFGVSIVVRVNDKLVIVTPEILKGIPLEDIATHLTNSSLTDEEIITAMETIDAARRNKVPTTDKT